MSTIQLMVSVTPDPETTQNAAQPLSLEEKVRDALDEIESGRPSNREWMTIRKLYTELVRMPHKSARINNLINMILPTMTKFGYHDSIEKE